MLFVGLVDLEGKLGQHSLGVRKVGEVDVVALEGLHEGLGHVECAVDLADGTGCEYHSLLPWTFPPLPRLCSQRLHPSVDAGGKRVQPVHRVRVVTAASRGQNASLETRGTQRVHSAPSTRSDSSDRAHPAHPAIVEELEPATAYETLHSREFCLERLHGQIDSSK